MSITALEKSNIDYAFQRLINFVTVNRSRDLPEKEESLILYCESVGINEDVFEYAYELCEKCFTDQEDAASCAFIGILLGLAVAEDRCD